uniref:Macaca fascicularis brain cDNA clone: QflA-21940, similar to human tubby homolog (mouse) (TUB), transcript variant 2, mRNA, RefSeq: NM_177972.1 n=1 Tax=Macaca fascicularis TaxID=9541 RepID=I7G762_MACFA|nr:unnamed protein product [Macaca fascicularis]
MARKGKPDCLVRRVHDLLLGTQPVFTMPRMCVTICTSCLFLFWSGQTFIFVQDYLEF